MPPTPDALLARNRAWVKRKTDADPAFFRRLADQQTPRYFWIGCSDSRVPATEIVDLDPGEMFVHRNVANLALPGDPAFSAGLLFAVDVLHVNHIIVAGHYGCGGIRAALEPARRDALGEWTASIRDQYRRHSSLLDTLPDIETRSDRLCEIHVVEEVRRLRSNPVVLAAWARGEDLTIHGWIYDIRDGLLQAICRTSASAGPMMFARFGYPSVAMRY